MRVTSSAAFVAAVAVLGAAHSASAANITVKNNCSYQIAIGVWPASVYANGGAFLNAGASVSFPSFPAGNGGRVWSRHNCVANGSGPDLCSSGQCGGTGIQCAGSTAAGVSEGEINFNASGTDWYDVSYVDGLNDATTIATSTGISYGCSSKPGCPTVLNNGYGGSGDSCQSPCTAAEENIGPWNGNTALYCCTGSYGTSATCPLSSWTSSAQSYVNGIHSSCPGEYAYAYDDSIGLHTIATGPSYTITFCGGGGSGTSSTSSTSTSSSSSGGTIANGVHSLTPACATGARLDDSGAGTANGNLVVIYQSNGTNAQNWNFANVGGTEYNMAVNLGPYCLDDDGGGSGVQTVVWSCNGGNNQKWNASSSGVVPAGDYNFFNMGDSLCLDVSGAGSANNTKVITYACNGTNAQAWKVQQRTTSQT